MLGNFGVQYKYGDIGLNNSIEVSLAVESAVQPLPGLGRLGCGQDSGSAAAVDRSAWMTG